MRTINVRLRNEYDVQRLSEKFKVNLNEIKELTWKFGLPNLFGETETITVKRGAYQRNENPIDISQYNWDNMPNYSSSNVFAYCHFKLNTNAPLERLIELFEQKLTPKTKSLWYPKLQPTNKLRYFWNSKSNLIVKRQKP